MINIPIRAVIVEDMVSYIDTIEILLNEVAPDVEVTGKASTLAEASRIIISSRPDLVLLDIQFEREGKTGYDLLEDMIKLNHFDFQVIIITGHTESDYYEKAFDFHVIHFLRKPLNKHRLSEAIARVRSNITGQQLLSLAGDIRRELSIFRSVPASHKLTIEGARYSEVVDAGDIIWIEAAGRDSVFHLKGGKLFQSSKSIGHIEEQLTGLVQFVRIHRSEIINMDYVKRFSARERLIVLDDPNANHYASKERFSEFQNKMNGV
jgi:two-component system, LytTR family, response regulator